MTTKASRPAEVRLGLIGAGSMGNYHINNIMSGQIKRVQLAAICDSDDKKLAPFRDKYPVYTDSRELIRSGKVDAVFIVTPHYFHTTIGIDALEQGLHVLTEKPISVHKADCERLIAAHRKNKKLVFAAMFNQRTMPVYCKLRELIRNGELGTLRRVNWIITDWFRSDAYYASGGWRATWEGEGGGVLLNQCPHNLDLMQWLFGMPSKVRAFCEFGKYHDIEVEDDVTAYLEYPNGATGIFITTTGEIPGTNRLEVTGDRGKVIVEGGKISFIRNEIPADEFCRTTNVLFGLPGQWNIEIPISGGIGTQHVGVLNNFIDAILDGAPLIAPGEEGINSVALGNAMILSTLLDKTIEMPFDGALYERHLKRLIRSSKGRKPKKVRKSTKPVDITSSF